MKKLITFILLSILSIGILSFGSFSVYAEDVTYTFDEEKYQIIPKDLSGTVDEPFLSTNEIMELMVALIIYIVALIVGMLVNSKLIISMSGLLWLIPITTIDNFIIIFFSIIMLIISLMLLSKERDDYYD